MKIKLFITMCILLGTASLIYLPVVNSQMLSLITSSKQVSSNKTLLEWIADEVDSVLRNTDKLVFEAELSRTFTGGQHRYTATVDMKVGKVHTKVYDMSDPKQLVAEISGVISPNKEPVVDQKDHIEDNDDCLFGSLTVPWIGSENVSSSPSFGKRIKDGKLMGMVSTAGRWCYKIAYHQAFDFTNSNNDNVHRKFTHVYFVEASSFHVLQWKTVKEDVPESKGDPNYTVIRLYRYQYSLRKEAS